MGSKKSLFGSIVDNAMANAEKINEDELHHSSTISGVTRRPRSRTNVLDKVSTKTTTNENVKVNDGLYVGELDPRQCQIWHRQSRRFDLLNEKECEDLISDFRGHIGQKIPIVIRSIPSGVDKKDAKIEYEVVAGSRRLWAAQYVVNQFNDQFRLRAILKDLDDKQAAIECEKENDREELTAFERGMYYHRLLTQGVFDSERQLSDSLNIPRSTLKELLIFGQLDPVFVDVFSDPREIKRSWAKSLHQLASNDLSKKSMLKKVKELSENQHRYTAQKIVSLLQQVGQKAIEVSSDSKFEHISKEVKDPETKRTAMKMERTRTNKIRISIENKISISKKDLLKEIDRFFSDL